MKRNMDQVLLDLEGKPFEDGSTLRTVCFNAIAATTQEDATLSADDKIRLYGLAKKIYPGGNVDFTTEELALVKKRVSKIYNAIVMGTVFELLDADPT